MSRWSLRGEAMNNKVKIISVVLCVVIIAGCYAGYSVAVSQAIYDITRSDNCSLIDSYWPEVLWTIPASEASDYGVYSWENDLQLVEITYELYNPVNDRITIPGNLFYYYGEDGSWLTTYDAVGNYSDISGYDNCRILPPGERILFWEYVLVPEGMKEIYAYGDPDDTEGVTIRIVE